jgi:hypothetical protein
MRVKKKKRDADLPDQRHRRDRSDTPEVTEGFTEGEFVMARQAPTAQAPAPWSPLNTKKRARHLCVQPSMLGYLCHFPDTAKIAVEACARIAAAEFALRLFLTADFASCNRLKSHLEVSEVSAATLGRLKPAVSLNGESKFSA